MADSEGRAFRLAGQAVAAALVGAPIDKVSLEDGLFIRSEKYSETTCQVDGHILAQILIKLMGVGAVQRYHFGVPSGEAMFLMPRPDQPILLGDIEQADELSTRLFDSVDYLEVAWNYAAEIILQPDVWSAVERVADAVLASPVEGRELATLFIRGVRKDGRQDP